MGSKKYRYKKRGKGGGGGGGVWGGGGGGGVRGSGGVAGLSILGRKLILISSPMGGGKERSKTGKAKAS